MEVISIAKIYWTIIVLLSFSGIGFVFHRKKTLTGPALDFISSFLINVSVPCLIFVELVKHFRFSVDPPFWVFLIISLVIFFFGLVLSLLIYGFKKDKAHIKEVVTLCAFQNSGYLPMNIVYFLFTGRVRENLLVYIFLYLFGFNLLIWGIGSFFIFKKKDKAFEFKSLFSGPIIAVFLALLLKYLLGHNLSIPEVIYSPLDMLGRISFPLSMIFLGANLSEAGMFTATPSFVSEVVLVSCVKLVIMPLFCFFFILKFNLMLYLSFFLIIQAGMPSAVSIPIVVRFRGGDYKFTSQAVFITHIFSIVSIPFWIYCYSRLF